jgi:hypothetical protein
MQILIEPGSKVCKGKTLLPGGGKSTLRKNFEYKTHSTLIGCATVVRGYRGAALA